MKLLQKVNLLHTKENILSAAKECWLKHNKWYTLSIIISLYWLFVVFILNHTLNNRVNVAVSAHSTSAKHLQTHLTKKRQLNQLEYYQKRTKLSGSTTPILTETKVLDKIAKRFKGMSKPILVVDKTLWKNHQKYQIYSYTITFKAKHDFEIFALAKHIFTKPALFGNVRIGSLNIEQVFEKEPVVKGTLLYQQMSLNP